jgi:hypothetical protein
MAVLENGYTLPRVMTKIYNQCYKNKINMFDWHYFTAKRWGNGIIEKTNNTYAIHHFAMTWRNPFEAKYLKVKWFFIKILGDNDFSKLIFRIFGKNIRRIRSFINQIMKG